MGLHPFMSRARWWVGLFIVAELAVGGASLYLQQGLAASLLHDVASLAAAGAIGAGLLWLRPPSMRPWLLVALAVLLFGCGDVAYEVDATGGTLALFSVGDWLYLGANVT